MTQQPLANIAEELKFRAFNRTEGSLKRSDMGLWIPLGISAGARSRDGIIQGKSMEEFVV